MSTDPNESQESADLRNEKKFGIGADILFFVFNGICLLVSGNRFGVLGKTPWLIVVPIAAVVYFAIYTYAMFKDKWWATQNYIAGVALVIFTFATAAVIAYCPSC